jgi:hypothetical protein
VQHSAALRCAAARRCGPLRLARQRRFLLGERRAPRLRASEQPAVSGLNRGRSEPGFSADSGATTRAALGVLLGWRGCGALWPTGRSAGGVAWPSVMATTERQRVSRRGDRQVRYSVGFHSALASAPVGMRCGKSRWDGRRLQAGLVGSGCLLERFERRKPRAQLLLLRGPAGVREGGRDGGNGGRSAWWERSRTPDRTGLVGFSRKCSEPSQAKEKAKRCARRARRLRRGVRRRVPLRGPEQPAARTSACKRCGGRYGGPQS